MVVFSDYQCIDCQRVEAEVRAALARRPEMSLGVRHFPMCSDCNPHVTRTLHAAACTAARVAEAAALLKGEAGFWPMHEWLFDVGGSFTGEQLDARLRELGFDVARFRAAMNDEAVTRAIQEDADLAVALGLHFTPLMYINGVELRGWQARNAVTRAVDALAARNPPPATSDNDRPPLALEKYIADWREQPAIRPPPDATRWPLGPDSARVRVVVFGDLMEPNTGEVDALLRRVCAQRQDVQYDFRHYPFNQECNPNVTSTRFPAACRAARAVEAAGRLGGAETYWRAMAWLVQNRDRFSDAALVALATDIQLDAAALQRAVDEPAGAAAIAEDVAAGKRLGVRSSPSVYVNHRLMPRWKLGDQPLVERIIDEAARP
jgi:protein-disulfide isomerase